MSQKIKTPYSSSCLCQILTNFHNYVTGTLSSNFAMKTSLTVDPLYLKHVATLPFEMLVFKNCTD